MIKDIFLIDDDELVNFLNHEIIKDSYPDKRIRSFENAIEALETLKGMIDTPNAEFPQLIFLDINMPIMDGWEFLSEFSQLPKNGIQNCKVVVHTSSIDPRDSEKAKTFAVVKDFVTKPLTISSLSKIFESK